jgi:hypothetical protein
VRFENKNNFFYYENAVAYYNAGIVVVNLDVVGCAPGMDAWQSCGFECGRNRCHYGVDDQTILFIIGFPKCH